MCILNADITSRLYTLLTIYLQTNRLWQKSVEDTPQARNLNYKLVSCVLLKHYELLFDVVIVPAFMDIRSYALSQCFPEHNHIT